MIYHTSVSQINWKKKNPHAVLHETDSMGACAADKTKPWFMSVYETAPRSLFLFRTCVPGFEYAPSHCRFANQDERKFETYFR